MSREAMKLALEALEILTDGYDGTEVGVEIEAVTALRQALETDQEPVAWISDSPTKGNGKQLHWTKAEAWRWSSNITPLYAAPPKQWVGLTEAAIRGMCERVPDYDISTHDLIQFARYIEAKLKEKNS